jgi:hypothetical protein
MFDSVGRRRHGLQHSRFEFVFKSNLFEAAAGNIIWNIVVVFYCRLSSTAAIMSPLPVVDRPEFASSLHDA